MHDPALVRGGQTLRNLEGPVHRASQRHLGGQQPLAQRRPLEQLHDRIEGASRVAEVVNREDVGMGEGGDGARLLLEAGQGRRITGEV